MKWIIALVLFIPVVWASDIHIDIALGTNDLVTEDVSISLDQQYDLVSYTSRYEPIDLSSESDYTIRDQEGYFVYSFPGQQAVEFSALYDGLVERHMGERIFRSTFYKEESDSMGIQITLPPHYILSKTEPSIMPKPSSITTDGRQIIITWDLKEDADILVFYESERSMLWVWIATAVFTVCIAATLYFVFKRRSERRINDTLTSEEQKVLLALGKVERQDHVAKKLEFSKSKMSKVVRKLEEKGLIVKEPYFKTNKLKKR
jgi:uncharacterized membrane protein